MHGSSLIGFKRNQFVCWKVSYNLIVLNNYTLFSAISYPASKDLTMCNKLISTIIHN